MKTKQPTKASRLARGATLGVCAALALATLLIWQVSQSIGQPPRVVPPTDPEQPPEIVEPPRVEPRKRRPVFTVPSVVPSPESQQKQRDLVGPILGPELTLDLDARASKVMTTKKAVTRVSVTNPEIVEVTQFSPTEFELVPIQNGYTTVTFWFVPEPGEAPEVLRYLVRVSRDEAILDRQRTEYGDLENQINELFPNSMIQLIPIADKLIVRGQARDSAEAAQILAIITNQAVDQQGRVIGPQGLGGVALGQAARPVPGAEDRPASNVINLLRVPGEHQVLLKVRVAELTRTALRQMGSDFIVNSGDFSFSSLLGLDSPAASAVLSTEDVTLALEALSSSSYSKILAEPNLVTLNGVPASFIAGGEFAVPTVVGLEGVGVATTAFRGFGTQLSFTPTIMDKDCIRLQVAPSFSTINSENTVNGIPGLNSRAAFTTVDLREGQWLAIAGLIQDQQAGSKVRVPGIGDVPILDMFFSRRDIKREETELIILVGPELVHPLETKQTPLILPGMEVTEPADWAFFLFGYYEGIPDHHHRSTVWPQQQRRILEAKLRAMHEAKRHSGFQESQEYYIHGPHGFSKYD